MEQAHAQGIGVNSSSCARIPRLARTRMTGGAAIDRVDWSRTRGAGRLRRLLTCGREPRASSRRASWTPASYSGSSSLCPHRTAHPCRPRRAFKRALPSHAWASARPHGLLRRSAQASHREDRALEHLRRATTEGRRLQSRLGWILIAHGPSFRARCASEHEHFDVRPPSST